MTFVKRIVEGYQTNGFNLSATNISMDRYYTSIPIAEWLYEKKSTCEKTKSGMRNVLLLTIMEPAHYVPDDKKKKPYMYKIYDFTKGSIDILHQ